MPRGAGEVLDIAVDVRLGSPTSANGSAWCCRRRTSLQIYIPQGFAHGFVVRSETADFLYKCSDYYDASDDRGVLWNDPAIGIDWQTPSRPSCRTRTSAIFRLRRLPRDQLPRYQP